MTNKDLIMQLVQKNNGAITTAQVSKAGLARGDLQSLVKEGFLERVSRGIYMKEDALGDEFFNLQTRYKKGVFSLGTALFLFDFTDRTPSRLNMTFPIGYNTSVLQSQNINFNRVKKDIYEMGVVEIKTPGGNLVKAYCIEKTLCDLLKGRNHTDVQIVSEAFKRYAKIHTKNIPLLSKYAKILRVEKRLRSYLEVLI